MIFLTFYDICTIMILSQKNMTFVRDEYEVNRKEINQKKNLYPGSGGIAVAIHRIFLL